MYRRGATDSQSYWLYQFLLSASADEDASEPQFVKVLRHVAGPFEDGSVRKQISDGDVFMDALFSLEAITSGILCDDSQIDWDSCDLLLKKFRVQYETPAINQSCKGQMVLVVSKCDMVGLNHGFTLKESPSFCMARPELQKRLQSYRHNLQPAEGSCLADSSLAVSLLMAQMSDEGSARTHSQPTHDLGRCMTFYEPPDLTHFVISNEEQLRLDDIEEWLSSYFPVNETPTLPPATLSDIAIQSDFPSQPHRQSPPPLPTNHPKILCDASVQVTFSQLDLRIRPATAEVGVEVGDSLMFNTQQSVADQRGADDSEESSLPVVVPHSALLPPVRAPCVQDFPPREKTWSSSSSLRLSCDEESNDIQLDPNLEMLGQRFASSNSSENMTVEEESPVRVPVSKTTTPSSSRAAIISGPSTRKIHLEEPTLDPVTTSILHCSEPERLDPVISSGTNLQFIQSTQIDYLSSQHCPIEPDFPLSPVMRLEEILFSMQSSEPFIFETAPVDGAKAVRSVQESSPCVGNVSCRGTVSGACENVPTGGNVPNSENVPISAHVLKDGNIPNGGNVPNSGNVPNVKTVVKSGNVPIGGNVQNGQSVSCRANVHSAGESSPTCGRVCTGENAISLGKFPNALIIGSQSRPNTSDGGIVCSSGITVPRVCNKEMAPNNEKFICNSGSMEWSSLPDMLSFGSAARENGAETHKSGDNSKSSDVFERVAETEPPAEEVSFGRIVGHIWASPPSQPDQRSGERETGESRATDKLRERNAGESPAGEKTGGTRAAETGTARKDGVKSSNIGTDSRMVNVRTEDVRTSDATKNNVPAVPSRRELIVSPRHIQTSERCQLIPASVSVPHLLSVAKKTFPANVSNHIATSNVSVNNQDAPARLSISNHLSFASVSVTSQEVSARVSVSKQTTPAKVSVSNHSSSARVSISDHLASASLPVSHQTSATSSTAGPVQQMLPSRSDLRINPATLNSFSVACANMVLPVSAAGSTSSTTVSAGCSTTSLVDNQSKNRTKSFRQADIVAHASGEVPRISELGCTGTYPCATSKPMEHESGEAEMDSFDELLMKSAELTKLNAELEPSELSSHDVVDPVVNSAPKLQVTSISTQKKTTDASDNVLMKDKRQKSGEKKNQKSLIRAKGSRLSLSQRRDPMALFAKHDLRKLTDNRKRKLFNVDQMLEAISSGNQTDSDNSSTQFGALEKRQKTLNRASDENKFKSNSGRKSKKTDTREKVDTIARVTVEQSSGSGHLGNNDMVTNVTSGLKTLSREIAKEPNRLDKDQTKKSKTGATGFTNSTLAGEELSKAVGLEYTQRDRSGLRHIDHVARHSVKDSGVATAGVNYAQTVPIEFTIAEEDRERNRETGALGNDADSNCKLSDNRSWRITTDKQHVGKSPHSRNRRSSADMFTSLTKKPNNVEMPEDATTHDRSDTRSCDKDIVTCIGTNIFIKSRDSSARKNNPCTERSVPKQTISNRDVVRNENRGTARDTTSRDRDTVESSGSSVREGLSKSGESQMSVPERLTLPTPKNSLPSHQPPRQSIPHDSDQLSPVSSEPSSPKFNRDRIKMLIGRDKMTADAAKAFSCSDVPENLKHWTYAYFKNWP